jgi:Flp pilus assembly protein TadG
MIKRMWRAARRQDRGSAAVEMAIVCPLFVALIAGVIDLGLMMYQRTVVGTAADAGTIYAIINGYNSPGITTAVQNSYTLAHGFATAIQATPAPSTFCGCPAANFSITNMGAPPCGMTCPGTNCSGALCPAGTYVTVNAQSNYTPVFPWSGPYFFMSANAVTLSASSTVRIQ